MQMIRNQIGAFLRMFELGDNEYIHATFGPWPLRFFVTILEPKMRTGWKKWQPWRFRCCLASLLLKWMFSRCTKCGAPFSLHELTSHNRNLIQFMSGSICHRECRDGWFHWYTDGFEHHLRLEHVAQWLCHGYPDEHALVWMGGCPENLRFDGIDARNFRDAMRLWMQERAR